VKYTVPFGTNLLITNSKKVQQCKVYKWTWTGTTLIICPFQATPT